MVVSTVLSRLMVTKPDVSDSLEDTDTNPTVGMATVLIEKCNNKN